MIRLLSIFMMSVCIVTGASAEEVSLTLNEAVALALRDNREILLKAEDVVKAQKVLEGSKGDRLPSVTLSGGVSDTMKLYNKDVTQEYLQGSVKQTLYSGGKVVNTIRYNELGIAVAQAVLDKTKIETVLAVQKAFYTLLLAGEYAVLNKEIVTNTQEHLASMLEQYKKGEVPETDLYDVEASLSRVKQVYRASINQVSASQALLRTLLSLTESVIISPQGEFDYTDIDIEYDQALLQSVQRRPEFRQYGQQEKIAATAIEIAKADNRPTVYASWDYYAKSHAAGLSGYTKNPNDYSIIGITFSWPVFDGWSTKAKIEQAVVDLKRTRLEKQKSYSDIALEVKNSYLDLQNAVARISVAKVEAEKYKKIMDVFAQQYQAGIASGLSYHDSVLAYHVSEFNHKNAIYDSLISKVSLEKAVGGSL